MEAMVKQLEKMTFAPPLHGIAEITLDFIEKVGSVTPANLNYCKAYSGGSEAVESALKLARQYQVEMGEAQRSQIISREQSYHGATLGAVAVSRNKLRREIYRPMLREFVAVSAPYCYRCAYDCADG